MGLLIVTLLHSTASGQQLCVVPLSSRLVHYMTDRIMSGLLCNQTYHDALVALRAHLPKCNLGSRLMYYTALTFHYLAA